MYVIVPCAFTQLCITIIISSGACVCFILYCSTVSNVIKYKQTDITSSKHYI